jgi:hypothetical protein
MIEFCECETLKPPSKNVIPPITDPMGKHWDQPKVEAILVDDHFACMTLKTLHELAEYNCTLPSGTYEGKMWRREVHSKPYGQWSREQGDEFLYHMLCWYGPHEDPTKISINQRVILLTD